MIRSFGIKYGWLFAVAFVASSFHVAENLSADSSASKDTSIVQPFDSRMIDKVFHYKTQNDVHFETVNAEELQLVFKTHDVNWMVIWSQWCPHCVEGLHKWFVPVADQMKNSEAHLILVCQNNNNFEYLQQLIFESGYKYMPYIIDPGTYSDDDGERIYGFLDDVSPNYGETEHSTPRNLIFDSKGKLLSYLFGEVVTADTLRHYLVK